MRGTKGRVSKLMDDLLKILDRVIDCTKQKAEFRSMDNLLQILDPVTGFVRQKADFLSRWTIYYKFWIGSSIARVEIDDATVLKLMDRQSSTNLGLGHRTHARGLSKTLLRS